MFDLFFMPAVTAEPTLRPHVLQLLVLARGTIQSTLLGRLCRQLCAVDGSGADDAMWYNLLAEHVPDSNTRSLLQARAAALAPKETS